MTLPHRFASVAFMLRRISLGLLVLLGIVLFPSPSPAPFIYRPGEGWVYEPVGQDGSWMRTRAKDQLQVARDALEKKKYSLASRAALRVTVNWPLSDYAPEAKYILGRSYEARKQDERAFKTYQELLQKYPKFAKYDEVLQRQYEIAGRFLGGQWFRLWNYIPIPPSMEKTASLYGSIVTNGPFSAVGPLAQMNIGLAQEKNGDYPLAVKAYNTAADRYHDQPQIAGDALFRAGLAYNKQARTAEYDQSVAGDAISTFTDFIALYPNDKRVPEAQKIIDSLKAEQARGNFQIAKFYDKKKRKDAALIYYNEVIVKDPNSPVAQEAKTRIAQLKNVPPPDLAPRPGPNAAPPGASTPAPPLKFPIREVPGEPPPK
ncbi:MAG: outer membrane protein assembly factor BamD [Verrucomicrobia bacterium]|nr:outer membrane protein assembly factor BamD [Verrucomicrobiota bacterium]